MHDRHGIIPTTVNSAASPGVDTTLRRALRSLAILGTGRILARVLMLGALPILAHVYDAKDFGLFGVYNTACSVLGVAAALCYERGIVPAKTDVEASLLTYLSLLLTVVTCSALEVVLILAMPVLRRLGLIESATLLILVLPVGIAFNSIVQTLLEWANRTHRDRIMSGSSVLRAATMLGIQFGAAWLAIGSYGLIVGQLGGSILAVVTLCLCLSWPGLPRDDRLWWQPLAGAARRLSALPLFSFPRALLEAGANILIISLMTELFGPAEVGLYWMAQRVVTIPSQVVDEPVTQLFYRSASSSLARGNGVIRPVAMTMFFLAAIAVPFVLVLIWAGDRIFGHILGPNWLPAAYYAKIMAAGWLAAEIAMPFHVLPILLNRLKFQLISEVVSQSARLGAILIAYAAGSFVLCLSLLAAQDMLFAILFGTALFWRKSTRAMAAPRVGTVA